MEIEWFLCGMGHLWLLSFFAFAPRLCAHLFVVSLWVANSLVMASILEFSPVLPSALLTLCAIRIDLSIVWLIPSVYTHPNSQSCIQLTIGHFYLEILYLKLNRVTNQNHRLLPLLVPQTTDAYGIQIYKTAHLDYSLSLVSNTHQTLCPLSLLSSWLCSLLLPQLQCLVTHLHRFYLPYGHSSSLPPAG